MFKMFFVFSKILWFFVNPFNVIIILLLAGLFFLLIKGQRVGNTFIGIGVLLIFVTGQSLLTPYLAKILENRIEKGKIPEEITGIIVEAGIIHMEASRDGFVELGGNADRIIEGVILARKHPEAKLIIVGGSGTFDQSNGLREADYAKRLAVKFGIDEDRVIAERNSRNTYEGAVEFAKTVPDSRSGRWVLITSAFHMPRSVGCFNKVGVKVIPYPVDFKTKTEKYNKIKASSFWPKIENIRLFNSIAHEWLGLIAYYVAGYTDTLFPKEVNV